MATDQQSTDSELAVALADLASGEEKSRGAVARHASMLLMRQARTAGAKAMASGQFLADVLIDSAPYLRVRDGALLTEHYHGLRGEALADALVRNAAKATAGLGAVVGTAAAAQWFAGPTLILVPVEIMLETLAVALVEIKLIAELHAVYDIPVPGSGAQRGLAFLRSWTNRRGVDPWRPWLTSSAMGAATRSSIAKRAMGRAGRGLGSAIPLLIGAVWAARLNRGQTLALAGGIRADLRTTRARLDWSNAQPTGR